MKRRIIVLLFIFLSPTAAFAYLDPGTGTMLVNMIIAGITAAIYFAKDIFLKLLFRGKGVNKKENDLKNEAELSILSEGKQYWGTFKPIVTALIQKNVPFKYYTLDVNDPALKIESEYMYSRFLGYGVWAYSRVSRINSNVLLATTPNIGTDGYPIKRPVNVKKMIHVFHSISGISMYRTGSLDSYDSVILAGFFQIVSIRVIENKRNLKKKELLPLGLPYLDGLLEEKINKSLKTNKKIVLVGSSWGSKGCLQSYGTEFIKTLAINGYYVIVRPHPQSYISEKFLINKYKKELSQMSNIEWDELTSPTTSMNKADILISDTSSIRFDFAYLYEKPVITLSIKSEDMPGYERDQLDTIWADKSSQEIGLVIERSDIDNLSKYIERALSEFDSSRIQQTRNNTIYNFGKAGEAIAAHFAEIYNY